MRTEQNESTPSETAKPADKPCGKFKSIGGIELRAGIPQNLTAEKNAEKVAGIDFSHLGGKVVLPDSGTSFTVDSQNHG